MQKNFLRLQVTGCSAWMSWGLWADTRLNLCLLCLLCGQCVHTTSATWEAQVSLVIYICDLEFKKHKLFYLLPASDITRVGVIVTQAKKLRQLGKLHPPALRHSAKVVARPSYKFVPSLQRFSQSLEPSLFTPAWTFCWTVCWVWFSELDCRMKGVHWSTVCKSDTYLNVLSAEEWLNKWQAIHSGNSTQLLKECGRSAITGTEYTVRQKKQIARAVRVIWVTCL